jgi:hypothetical protein
MAFPLIPVALASGVGLLLLLARKKGGPGDRQVVPPPEPPPPGPGPRRKTRPSPFPEGAGEATVIPNAQNGIRTRQGPGTDETLFPRVAPDGDPRLAYNSDTVAVLEMGIPEQGPNASPRSEWWRVLTPGGLEGFSRAVDPQGVSNFNLISPPNAAPAPNPNPLPIPQVLAGPGVGAALPGWGRAAALGRYARCAAPPGCWLRPSPDARAPGQAVVERGGVVHVLQTAAGPKRDTASPGPGGWARVRYTPRGGRSMEGWVLSEWLVS